MDDMSQTIWSSIISKIKQFRGWTQGNRQTLIAFALVFGTIAVTSFISWHLGIIATTAKDAMLKPLIEAEATILGFFGLIVIYALTSLDNRTDRIEQQLFDVREKYLDCTDSPKTIIKIGKDKATKLNGRLSRVAVQKRQMIKNAVGVGSFLVVSLSSSIFALGITDAYWAFFICWVAIYLLFGGIVLMLTMLYFLAESPEATTSE